MYFTVYSTCDGLTSVCSVNKTLQGQIQYESNVSFLKDCELHCASYKEFLFQSNRAQRKRRTLVPNWGLNQLKTLLCKRGITLSCVYFFKEKLKVFSLQFKCRKSHNRLELVCLMKRFRTKTVSWKTTTGPCTVYVQSCVLNINHNASVLLKPVLLPVRLSMNCEIFYNIYSISQK